MATRSKQRTMKYYRDLGHRAEDAERWIHFGPTDPRRKFGLTGIKQDFMKIIDIIVLDKSRGFGGVQACGNDFKSHLDKMLYEGRQSCIDWLETPCGWLVLMGWRKLVLKKGMKRKVWTPRIQEITLKDLE